MKRIPALFASLALLVFTGCGSSSVPKPAATADAAVMQVVDGLNENNAAAPWHMLPASYQNELTEVKNAFAEKMDAEIWDQTGGVMKKLHTVLEAKKELILASPRMKQMPMAADLEANYDHLVSIIGSFANSDLATLEGFKGLDIAEFLSGTGSEIMETVKKLEEGDNSIKPMIAAQLFSAPERITSTKAELVSSEGDNAVVRISMPGEEPEEVDFVKVEGKWIPKDLQEVFPEMIADMKEAIADIQITPAMKAEATTALSTANTVLDKLGAAKTQEELQGVMMSAMGMMMGGMR